MTILRFFQDFVANVSHELRAPLTAVRGSVDALLDEEGLGDQRRFLDIIARQTTRMERLVGDLLRPARLNVWQETLSVVSCPVKSLFDAVRSELAPYLRFVCPRIDARRRCRTTPGSSSRSRNHGRSDGCSTS